MYETFGSLFGKCFSTLQWDSARPAKQQGGHNAKHEPSPRKSDTRLQHSRADDTSWLLDKRAEESLEAERPVTKDGIDGEPPKVKLKLTPDGRLPPRQPVRLVSEDGSHRFAV